MKSRSLLLLSAMLCGASATGQTVSFPTKFSDIVSIALDADGWLVGKDSSGKAKAVYPIRFEVEPKFGETYAWKVGELGFVFVPRTKGSDPDYRLIAVPLLLPAVDPIWSEEEAAMIGLGNFVDVTGEPLIMKTARGLYSAFSAPDSLSVQLSRLTSDVNNRNEPEIRRKEIKLQKATRELYKTVLENINVSLYLQLGFDRIKVPPQIYELQQRFSSGAVVPKGSARRELMLLNRFLIDRKLATRIRREPFSDGNIFGRHLAQVFRWQGSYRDEAEINVSDGPLFSAKAYHSLSFIQANGKASEYKMRPVTTEEAAEIKAPDVRLSDGKNGVSIPEGATDADLTPLAVLEGPGHKWILSKKGYCVYSGPGSYANQVQLGPMNDFFLAWLQEGPISLLNYSPNSSTSANSSPLSGMRLSKVTMALTQGNQAELRIEGAVSIRGNLVRFTNAIDRKLRGVESYISSQFGPSVTLNIDKTKAEQSFVATIWEDKTYTAKGENDEEVRKSINAQSAVSVAGKPLQLFFHGGVVDGALVLDVYDWNAEKALPREKIGTLTLGWH